jgi:hypothetical protein
LDGWTYLKRLLSQLDIRDILVFGGLSLLGYGLYLVEPWIAFAVCGFLLMLIGYLMGEGGE